MRFFRNQMSRSFKYLLLSAVFMGGILGCATLYYMSDRNMRSVSTVLGALIVAGIVVTFLLALLLYSMRKVGRQLTESEELFRVVFENAAVGLIHIDSTGRVLHVNEAFCHITGYVAQALLSQEFNFGQLFYSQTVRNKLFPGEQQEYTAENRYVITEPCRVNGDRMVWLDMHVERIVGDSVHSGTYVIAAVDVTKQRRVAGELAAYRENLEQLVDERTAELMESEGRFRFIAEHNHDVIWTVDLQSQRMTYVSPSVEKLRGLTVRQVMSQSPWDSFTPASRKKLHEQLGEVLQHWDQNGQKEQTRIIEARQYHKDGHAIDVELVVSIYPNEKGAPGALLGVTHNITERKRTEQELRRMAFYDGLTGLANRRLLYDRLRQAIRHAHRRQRRIALLFIDLDNFKPVNDQLGHHIGDWLLKAVSVRMQDVLRAYDTAARMGGDEFIVLLPDLEQVSDALVIAERIRTVTDEPFITDDGKRIRLTASIGVALFPDHADNEHDLLRMGDDAMYHAKRSGRNRVEMLAFPPALPTGLDWALSERDMPLSLSWNAMLESGDSQLDAEHQHLFEQANHVIYAAMIREEYPERFNLALDNLLHEMQEHFNHEEEILLGNQWPQLQAHIQKHQYLLAKAAHLRAQAETDALPIRELVDFLAIEMVVQHIMTDDRQYFHSIGPN